MIAGAPAAPYAQVPAGEEDEAVELPPFPVTEQWPERSERILPTDRDLRGMFGEQTGVLETPRSVGVVTAERLRLSGVDGFDGLSELGAGTERVDYWGIAGSPYIRGTHAGVYFNGMLRAYQRNEMPTSFGSAEALQIVRGPAPAHLTPAPVGGYVDMDPKSPYFGPQRTHLSLSAGSWDKYRAQLDSGSSGTVAGHPAAWRVSLTVQNSGSYYDNVRDDYVSLFASGIVRLDRRTTLSFGGEFYDYRSNEVSGWNRITQNLVDKGQYVIGEPIDITDPKWGGTANRDLVSYPWAYGWKNGIADFNALVVPGSVVMEALASGRISQAAVDAMLNLSDADDRARAYGQPLPSTGQRDSQYDASGNAAMDATLARLSQNEQSGYRYTKEYFEQGGVVFTEEIEGNQILADKRDFANSRDGIAYIDWRRDYDGGRSLENKFFSERLRTRKHSSYGFALNSDQLVLADRLSVNLPLDSLDSRLSFGAEARYTWVVVTQDFYAEPFSRRDVSLGSISSNSSVLAGEDIAPDGLNLWSPGRGANLECNLLQGGVFALADTQLTERLRLYYGLRGDFASWHTHLADVVDRTSASLIASSQHNGSTFFGNASVNPVYKLAEGLYLYGAAQAGTALAPGDAGTVVGKANFSKANLLEAGIKSSLLGGRLFMAIDAYRWQQSRYSELNARALPMRGMGVEAELAYQGESFSLTGSYTFQRVRLLSDSIGYGQIVMSEEDWALGAGAMEAATDRVLANNPDRVYEGTPRHSAMLMGVWKLPKGYGLALGPHWRGPVWASMDRSVRLPSSVVWNGLAYWRGESWSLSLRIKNLFDEDWFKASDPVFSGNVLVTKAEPRSWEIAATYSF